MKRIQLTFPQRSDYLNSLKVLNKSKPSKEYHQLIEASASAYFETKGPAKWLFMKRFQLAVEYLNRIGMTENLLDAGTGIGFFLPTLSKAAKNVWALDYASHTLEYSKALCKKLKIKNVKFKQGNLTKLPFKPGQFDVIVALSILEHILPQKLPAVIDHFKRVLKPDGYLIAGYPNEGGKLLKITQLLEIIIMRPKLLKSIKDDKRKYKPLGHVATLRQIDQAIMKKFTVINIKSLIHKNLNFYGIRLFKKGY